MYRGQSPEGYRPVPTTPNNDFTRQSGGSIRASGKRRFRGRDNPPDLEPAPPSTFFSGPMYTNDGLTTPPKKRRFYNSETPSPLFSPNTIHRQSTQRTTFTNRQPLREQLKSPYPSPNNHWRGSPRVFTPTRTPPARLYSSGAPGSQCSARRSLFSIDRKPKEEQRQLYTFTPCQVNFQDVNDKPHLRLIPSFTSMHYLEEPVAVVFEEQTQNWYVADRRLGLVVINRDMTKRLFVMNMPEFENITALVVLNGGDYIGFLCSAGICVFDTMTNTAKVIYESSYIVQGSRPESRLRGLAITGKGEFVTIDRQKYRIAFISQITGNVTWHNYQPPFNVNVEGEPSSPTYVTNSTKQIVVVDYTLASFTIFRHNPDVPSGLSAQDVDATGSYPQCRLSAPFVDSCGRIMICNKKEHSMMMYDHDGRYLQTVFVSGGFCRAQSFWINNANQVGVIDKTTRPHRLRMYALKPDHEFKKRMDELKQKDHDALRNQRPMPSLPIIKKHSPPSTPKREPIMYPYPGPTPAFPQMMPLPGPYMMAQAMPYYLPPHGFSNDAMYPKPEPYMMNNNYPAPPRGMVEPSFSPIQCSPDDGQHSSPGQASGYDGSNEDFLTAAEDVIGDALPSSPDPSVISATSNNTMGIDYTERSDSGCMLSEHEVMRSSPLPGPSSSNESIGSDTPVRNGLANMRLN